MVIGHNYKHLKVNEKTKSRCFSHKIITFLYKSVMYFTPCLCRCCWRPLLPISSPALPLSVALQPALLSVCVSTHAENTTSTPGCSTCCLVRKHTHIDRKSWNRLCQKSTIWTSGLTFPHLISFFMFLPLLSTGLVVPVDEEHSTHLILGVLLTLRYLMPLLQQQTPNTSLKGSFGLVRKEADVSPSPEQLIQVPELTKAPQVKHVIVAAL